MTMNEEIQDNSQSVTEGEVAETTEQATAEETPNSGEGERFQELYENQKIRAEKAEARLKELQRDSRKTEKETESKDKPETDDLLLQKADTAILIAAQITEEDEVELALETSKKWDMPVEKLIADEDFQTKLKKVRNQKANELATADVKGGAGTSEAKNTAEYWIAKGTPPTRDQVKDRKTRAKIARAFIANESSSKKFYND